MNNRFAIAAPSAANLSLATNPSIGGDYRAYISRQGFVEVGKILQSTYGDADAPTANGVLTLTSGVLGQTWTIEGGAAIFASSLAHNFSLGQVFTFDAAPTPPAGFTAGTAYYVRPISATTFTLHGSAADARSNTDPIDATGVIELTYKLGVDLAISAYNGLVATSPVSVKLGVTFSDASSGTVTAVLKRPTQPDVTAGAIPAYDTPIYIGADLVPDTTPTKKVWQVNSLTGITNGDQGNAFRIFVLPDKSSFILVGCAKSTDVKLPIPKPKNFLCGTNPTAFVRTGVREIGTLTLRANHRVYGADLSAANGLSVSVMVESLKDERLTTERILVGGCKLACQTPTGTGDDEVETTGEGMYENVLVFTL